MNISIPSELRITPVLNGFILSLGCQSVVYRSGAELAGAIEGYYKNPELFVRTVLIERINNTMTAGQIENLLNPPVNGDMREPMMGRNFIAETACEVAKSSRC